MLAREGINGTIAGAPADVHAVLAYLRADPLLADLEHKESFADKPPFHRMKVRLKKEIVTMGIPSVSPTKAVGTYVKPEDWNALISDPDVILLDIVLLLFQSISVGIIFPTDLRYSMKLLRNCLIFISSLDILPSKSVSNMLKIKNKRSSKGFENSVVIPL